MSYKSNSQRGHVAVRIRKNDKICGQTLNRRNILKKRQVALGACLSACLKGKELMTLNEFPHFLCLRVIEILFQKERGVIIRNL